MWACCIVLYASDVTTGTVAAAVAHIAVATSVARICTPIYTGVYIYVVCGRESIKLGTNALWRMAKCKANTT